MWSDSESRIDYLNYSEVSEMIAEILSDDSMLPTSIGVYGSWGVGKSSILRLISQELSDDRYVVVDFDAWLYQDFDEAKSALMTVIAKSLYAAAPKDKKEIAASFYRRVNKLKVMGIAMDLGALAMGVPTFGGMTKGLGALGNIFRGEGDVEDVGDVRGAIKEGDERLGGLLREKEKQNPPEEIDAFRAEFSSLLSAIDRRLVVFVDNLDRCLPPNTIATLEAMRLFLFLPKTAFIVAADEDMIRHSVAKHFSGPGNRHVSDYLDKLINVPVRVPKLGLQEVRAYLFMLAASQGELGEDEVEKLRLTLIDKLRRSWSDEPPITVAEVAAILKLSPSHAVRGNLDTMDLVAYQLAYAERVQGNPRIVKRLLNVIRMRAAVARRREMPFDESLIAKLALFERCTDGEAIRLFGRLVNEAEKGKVDLLTRLEAIPHEDDQAFEQELSQTSLTGQPLDVVCQRLSESLAPANGDADRIRVSIDQAMIEVLGENEFDPAQLDDETIQRILGEYLAQSVFQEIVEEVGGSWATGTETSTPEAEGALLETIRAVIEVNLGPRLEGNGNIVQADIRQFMRETINEVWATWEAYGE